MNLLALKLPGGQNLDVSGVPTLGPQGVDPLIQFIVTSLLIIASLLSLAFLIWGGIQWSASGGDKTAVETARKRITYALIGLVVVFLSFFIIQLISNFFGVKLLDIPEQFIRNPIDCPPGAGGCR